MHPTLGRTLGAVAALALAGTVQAAAAQDAPAPAAPAAAAAAPFPRTAPLGQGPWEYETEAGKIRVEVFARRLDHPWSVALLPDGSMLVTERVGRLRVIRNGRVDPVAIAGLPPINPSGIGGLYDIVLDPDFASNRRIYFSYVKPAEDNRDQTTLAVARATWDGGMALADVEDIFVADAWYGAQPWPRRCCGQGPASGSWGGRILFGTDGKLYITSGDRNYGEKVQDQSNHFGKILRINPDGSVPSDNPFVGQDGWKPEIWTTGHRNPLGLTIHPETGRMWSTEFGPRGGDELNLIEKGNNYGWMDVTQGEHYNNDPVTAVKGVEGMTDPVISFGPPSLNPGNIAFYNGTALPGWRGSLLLPSFTRGLLRIEFDEAGNPGATEELLGDIRQRLRDVRVGPEGEVYILTDETEGAILKITPAG